MNSRPAAEPSWQPIRRIAVDRVGGGDRIDTAVDTSRLGYAAAGAGGRQAGGAVLTRADNFPDALAGGALLGAHATPLLLADGPRLPGVEGDYAAAEAAALDEVLAFGGTDVVPDAAAFALGDAAGDPGRRTYSVNRTAPFLP